MSKNQNQQEHKEEDYSSKKVDQARSYAKYSGMAIQMGVIILIGALAGRQLDAYFELSRPWFTIFLSLLAIFAALYVTLKDLVK